MVISYDAYRTFYTVAKLGSFTRAANALMSSQPNLTRTIRNLESVLGCTLFVRSNRGVSLTPEGEKLFARVLGFWIMAPSTVQRAAFKENGGANAWTVVQAKAL